MKLPFISRKKYLQLQNELAEYKGMFHSAKAGIEERKRELSQLKSDLSLSEQQAVSETEKLQKPLMQDDKDRQIKNLKLKIEAKERELEEQKNITHFKNQIINGLKGYTEPRKDLEEKYSEV